MSSAKVRLTLSQQPLFNDEYESFAGENGDGASFEESFAGDEYAAYDDDITPLIEPIRTSQRISLFAFVAAHFAIAALVNLVLFAADTFRPLASATGGLFTGSLLVNVLLIALLVGLIIGKWGRLRPYDVGLVARNIPRGILYTAALWFGAQIVHAIMGLLFYGQIVLHPLWSNGWTFGIGLLLAQIFGNALFEEIAYRGFLFPQFFLRLKAWQDYPATHLALAIFLSQMLFALSHIPNRIYLGMSPVQIAFDLLMLLGWGILYTLIYIRTDNLFIVVGIHALGNTPTTLFATAPILDNDGASFLIYALAFIALFAYPQWKSHRARVQHQAEQAKQAQQSAHAEADYADYSDDSLTVESTS